MTVSLKWVRWDSNVFQSAKWLSTPMDQRGVWAHLILLAGKGLGSIEETPEQLAVVMRCDVELVMKALDTFRSYGALKRYRKRWVVVNFAAYNPGAKYLSSEQRSATREGGARVAQTTREGGARVTTYVRTDDTNGTYERHRLLEGYPDWIAQENDLEEMERLLAKFPQLDFEEELADFMAYARKRAATPKAYVDYMSAFRNQIVRHAEKKPRSTAFEYPDLSREEARVG